MLEISQGNSYLLTFNIKNSDGSTKDMSGTQELKYKVARRKSSKTNILELVYGTDSQLQIIDEVGGKVTVRFEGTEFNSVPEGTYYHEMWHRDALGEPTTLVSENISVISKLIKE
jgi:hypothetical protein